MLVGDGQEGNEQDLFLALGGRFKDAHLILQGVQRREPDWNRGVID